MPLPGSLQWPLRRPALARCAAPCRASPVCSSPALVPRVRRSLRARAVPQAPHLCASTQRHHAAASCTSTMHQHSCSSLVLARARAFRLAAGGAFFRTARFSASRECVPSHVPSQEQQALQSAPALLVCSHVVFCFRCAQGLSITFAPSLSCFAPSLERALGASDDGSGVFPPPVSVARRRSSRYPAARALLARSPVAFCFCCAQVQPRRNSCEKQSDNGATIASQPFEPTVASADAARSGHKAPSAPCTSTEQPPQVVPTLDNSRALGPSHRKRPRSMNYPSVTAPRRPAHSVKELCDTTVKQFELELDINHGAAVREGVGVWHHPMEPMRLVDEVFAPALRRATKQAYAWSISRRNTLRCPHCTHLLVPSPDAPKPNNDGCAFVPGGEFSPFSPTSSGGL